MASGVLERYLLEFNDALIAGAERRERILAEVEDHLRDAVESLMGSGATAAEAELEAVRRFGEPGAAAERFGPDPLGWAQHVARWYDARRVAHPVLVPVVAVSPWFGLIAWLTDQPWIPLIVWLPIVWMQISNNLRARGTSAFVVSPRTLALLRHVPPSLVTAAAVTAMAVVILQSTTVWFQVIVGLYALCGLAIFVARPNRCVDAACERCSQRWSARHPSAAIGVRSAAWALALAGPALAEIVPLTAGRIGLPAVSLLVFAALAPLPTRRSEQWLCRRRPTVQVALRLALPLALLLLDAVHRPSDWMLALVAATLMAYLAVALEIRRSRFRSDATRRRLLARVDGVTDQHATG